MLMFTLSFHQVLLFPQGLKWFWCFLLVPWICSGTSKGCMGSVTVCISGVQRTGIACTGLNSTLSCVDASYRSFYYKFYIEW